VKTLFICCKDALDLNQCSHLISGLSANSLPNSVKCGREEVLRANHHHRIMDVDLSDLVDLEQQSVFTHLLPLRGRPTMPLDSITSVTRMVSSTEEYMA
jgi:hypothetical protein